MAQIVLALEYSSKRAREGDDLIDALPYIDVVTPEMKKKVDSLIEEEMRRSSKKPAEFMKEMPPMPTVRFEGHPVLANEYQR
jgi:pre-mRNA-splicing factor SPF27